MINRYTKKIIKLHINLSKRNVQVFAVVRNSPLKDRIEISKIHNFLN